MPPMPGPEAAPALRAEGVTRRFGGTPPVTALDGVGLEVRPGQVTGLIGPDGAGKTTFMRLACGLLRADAGRIECLGIDVGRDPVSVQERVGYMPQRFGLYEDLSVQENLDLYADLQNLPEAERPARYAELMHMTGLGPFTDRLAGRLSGGMKQKLGLACTLVRPPRLLLLDEPTVGVDPVSRRELWQIVYRLVREQGMAVLLSTAYLDEAERCDRVVILHHGRVLGEGSPQGFREAMRGRVHHARLAGVGKRSLLMALQRTGDILDAVIEGSRVRLVTTGDRLPDLSHLNEAGQAVETRAAEPRFEDWFITRLCEEGTSAALAEPPAEAHKATDDRVIEVTGAERRFGTFLAVHDVSFSVRRGEVFGLLGANGAGKSTLFRMLCGLLPASGGRLRVAGVDLRQAPAHARARIGYMAQRFSLYAELTVAENLAFFARAYGLGGQASRQRIDWALATFELGPLRRQAARNLPLGFKQRLALAAALLHEPDILFLDEPTSGVDPVARREFWSRINALSLAGTTVLVTTHFMEEAEYCDRLVIMAEGRVLAEGSPEAMREQARSAECPDPTLEEAFIRLLEQHRRREAAA
ncbi:ATP-binding cassette domain-containing protein [Thiohalobacter sp.]|uniref:ATP-binding cassette domain-containing protein n=1 Tax=Thiohalobacter sp. TaxID=2025948 RepID=UPI002612071F|nr:ATP-binding cassette domain-containing protein [Thiohalobacter sp.]